MKLKYLLISATVLSITLSSTAIAKKPEGKGNPHSDGPDARWENSNRQSDEYSRKGQERAEERHRVKESEKHKYKNKGKEKKHKKGKYHDNDKYDKKHDRYEHGRNVDRYNKKHDKDEYYDRDEGDDRYEGKHDRYERQRYKERYQNNPMDTAIDRNVDDAKSIIDNTHRKTLESIDNKSRDLTGDKTRRDRTTSDRPWWSIFGSE